MKVGGLDGCRGGWVLAVVDTTSVEITAVERFESALARVTSGELAALAVDMPIGLPDDEPRAADHEARRRLGRRRSTVFPTPVRATLDAVDYADALAISRRVIGKGLSKQAFNLLPRIAEVDRALTPDHQHRVFECHPELAFSRLAGGPLLTSKHTAEGMAERVARLDAALAGRGDLVARPPGRARPDDVADALAIALVARWFVAGQVEHLGDGARDRRGLRMEIVV